MLFFCFLGLLCGVVSGSPVAPGSCAQQWPLQAPLPSTHAWDKNRAYFLKIGCFFCFWSSWGFSAWSSCLCGLGIVFIRSVRLARSVSTRVGIEKLFIQIPLWYSVVFGASVWRGEWIPCGSWKLHPTVGSTSPNSFKHAWDKNRAYFLKMGCCFFFGLLGASVWRGEWIPCSSWKLHPTVGSTSMLGTKIGPIS